MLTIKSFLMCKKPRRSNRLEIKEREEKKVNTIRHGPLGYFDILPLELKFHVLTYLSVEDLSHLTIVSKSMRNLIEGFRVTRPNGRHLLPSPFLHKPVSLEQQMKYIGGFKKLGLLMKRSTCLYSTKDRLKFLNDFLSRVMCCNIEICEDSSKCIVLTCFGKFFHTMIAGWDDSECQRAFDSVCCHADINKKINIIVYCKPGTHLKMENDIRSFFRQVFLDQCDSVQTRAFWISRILKSWPMVQQAKLLFLLYGPKSNGEILWHEMCENTPENCVQSSQNFGDLANTIQILHHYQQEWSEDDVITVMDELTSTPDEWLAENIANLMILCGDDITSKMLISKAINGRIVELSSITTSFCLVCVKNSFSIGYVVSTIKKTLEAMDNSKDRLQFVNSIMDMFRELILDLHEFSDPEEGHQNDMYFTVTAMSELSKKLLQLTFKNLLA